MGTIDFRCFVRVVAAGSLLAGGVAVAAGPALLSGGGDAGVVPVEAESSVGGAFVEVSSGVASASASGGRFIAVVEGSGNQSGQPVSGSRYPFELVAGGDVAMWARVWTPDAGSDAFWYRVGDAGVWSLWSPGVQETWTWKRVVIEGLEAGSHSLNLAHREDGVRVDAVLFSSDLNFVPGNGLGFLGDTGDNRHHVEVAGSFDLTEGLTLEAWVKLDTTPAGDGDPIIAKGGEWGLSRYRRTNKLVFRTGGDEMVSLGELEPGRWTHVAGSLAGGTKRFYIDGVLNRTKTEVGGVAPGPALLRFGANVDAPSGVFRGELDEVRVWSVERSAAAISAGRRGILEGDEAGLEGYWRFEGSGLTAVDSSGAGRDGVLEGFLAGAPLRVDGVGLTGGSRAVQFARRGGGGRKLDVIGLDSSAGEWRVFSPLTGTAVSGTIAAEPDYGTSTSQPWVGTADVDGDGDLDAVFVERGADGARLFLNNGTLEPFAGVAGSVIVFPEFLGEYSRGELGDLDGDGRIDLIVGSASNGFYLYLNNGSGDPFGGVVGTRIGTEGVYSDGVAVGDVDGDGDADVIVANYGDSYLYLNNGTADPFAGVAAVAIFSDRGFSGDFDTGEVKLGDLDGDGDLDAVVSVVGWGSGPLGIYFNNGSAAPFTGVSSVLLSAESFSGDGPVGLGDVDGDGDLDVVACRTKPNFGDSEPDRLFLNNGTADPFGGVAGIDISGGNTTALAMEDVDGDGDLDLFFAGAGYFGDPVRVSQLYLNNGTATPFAGVVPSDAVVPSLSLAVADIIAGEADASGGSGIGWLEAHLLGAAAVENALRFGEAFTFETWVRYDEAPASRVPLVEKGASWGVYLDEVGRVVFATGRSVGGVDELRSEAVLTPGEWVHVAVVSSAAGSGLPRKAIYLGGALDAEKGDVAGAAVVGTEAVTFGGDGTVALVGVMDEIRAWDRALGPETIAAQYANNLSGREPGLLLLWRLEVDEPAVRNSALNGPGSAALTATYQGGGSEGSSVPGVVLGGAPEPQFDLFFDGTEYVEVAHDEGLNFSPALTVEVWVRPTEPRPSTVLVKGSAGYGLGLDVNLRPVFFEGSDLLHSVSASVTLALGEWSHVAVVVENAPEGGPNGRTVFYVNGELAGVHSQGVIVNNGEPLYIGKAGVVMPQGFVGEIDEVRLWASAIGSGQIGLLAQMPLPSGGTGLPDLEGYWAFDEGTGGVAGDLSATGRSGVLVGMDETNWRYGHDFGVPPLPGGLSLATWAGSAGLWIGQVVLDEVSEVKTSNLGRPGPVAATGDTAGFRILLHVDEAGRVRLLKDVVMMQRRDDPEDPESAVSVVLVTEPELIPNFEGIVVRGGKRVGLRQGSVGYDFTGTELGLLGGVGPALGCAGNIVLRPDHPTNPYRHKFHPRHGRGFTITRAFGIAFDGNGGDPLSAAPGFGVERITGSYEETVTGLHKIPIRVRGRVELTRISDVGVLNE